MKIRRSHNTAGITLIVLVLYHYTMLVCMYLLFLMVFDKPFENITNKKCSAKNT